jgi:hypothetical protein
MTEKDLSVAALAALFDNPKRAIPNIHIWLAAKGTPGPRYRRKLAQMLGIEPEQLSPTGASTAKPSKALVVLPKAKASGQVPLAPAPTAVEAGFAHITITRDGAVVIRLTLTKDA